ncbi:T-cell surface glycoprotein CD1b-3 [Camelus dromedarius]|uniref:T-cell surface glycoprotein CD1b-3 n=1 Tax=Camelus dromedarius TaxID=9838 RepID=A0A5N4CMS5_CAMDR|nr:T-cell surface glycoprotein CD1b-3 [Camelus dromedarius]
MRGEREQQGTQEKRLCASCRRDVVSSVVLGSGSQRGTWPELPVGHSSLGDQDIVLYWGHRSSVGWIFLAVTVPLLLLAVHILGSDAVEFLCFQEPVSFHGQLQQRGVDELETLFRTFFINFALTFHNRIIQWQLKWKDISSDKVSPAPALQELSGQNHLFPPCPSNLGQKEARGRGDNGGRASHELVGDLLGSDGALLLLAGLAVWVGSARTLCSTASSRLPLE